MYVGLSIKKAWILYFWWKKNQQSSNCEIILLCLLRYRQKINLFQLVELVCNTFRCCNRFLSVRSRKKNLMHSYRASRLQEALLWSSSTYSWTLAALGAGIWTPSSSMFILEKLGQREINNCEITHFISS